MGYKDICYDLHIWSWNLVQGYCKIFTQKLCLCEAGAKEHLSREYICSRIFSVVQCDLDLQTSIKSLHTLTKGTLWVIYDPDWAKGREDMLWTIYLKWTDRQTDHLIGCPQSKPRWPDMIDMLYIILPLCKVCLMTACQATQCWMVLNTLI